MDLPLFNGRPVTIAADVQATTDYIPLRRSSELGDARHAIISPAEFGAAISPYVSSGVSYTAGTGLTLSGSIFAIDSTVVVTSATQVLTNKTLTNPIVNLGSDATGDIYYRNGSGLLTRLPVGSSNQTLTVAAGIPSWATPAASSSLTAGTGITITSEIVAIDSTVVVTSASQVLTNKTLTSPIINVGSDANGDLYYRSGGSLIRLPIGSSAQTLVVSAGLPYWQTPTAGTAYFAGTGLTLTGDTFATDSTVVVTSATQVLTNKTLTSPVINLGSDATGDIYYRDGSGNYVRLPIGSATHVLTVAAGIPSWAAPTGGGSTTTTELTGITKFSLGSTAYVELTASRTATDGDNGRILFATTSAAYTFTIPDSLSKPFGCTIIQEGTGAIAIAVSGTAVLRNVDVHTKTGGQWAAVAIDYRTGNNVILSGRTTV